MPFRIIRNDITQMDCDAIVNTASSYPMVGPGCDTAVYRAAGYDLLMEERRKKGYVPEGEAFATPGFGLKAKYIIHAVSPLYVNGESDEEKKLRSCYRNAFRIASDLGISSIAFPLISTGSFGYPREEGMRIAVGEIHAFLFRHEMAVTLVVFDEDSTRLGQRIAPDLALYIDRKMAAKRTEEEYGMGFAGNHIREDRCERTEPTFADRGICRDAMPEPVRRKAKKAEEDLPYAAEYDFGEEQETALAERLKHLEDTFSDYLLYLIRLKGLTNADVYTRACIDKKAFSKIKNNPQAHPKKETAMCLCIGAKLNLDEAKDLLARAGYALSPSEMTDVIFSYFIENGIYDMIELSIQLENAGLPCFF